MKLRGRGRARSGYEPPASCRRQQQRQTPTRPFHEIAPREVTPSAHCDRMTSGTALDALRRQEWSIVHLTKFTIRHSRDSRALRGSEHVNPVVTAAEIHLDPYPEACPWVPVISGQAESVGCLIGLETSMFWANSWIGRRGISQPVCIKLVTVINRRDCNFTLTWGEPILCKVSIHSL